MLFATPRMDREIINTKWCMSDRGRQISYDITYMWHLENEEKDLFRKQKQTHRHRKQTYGYQRQDRWIRNLRLADTNYYI